MQARERDSQANDLASGTSTRESFANWHPDSLSWKTSQRSLLVGWTPYSEPWPRSGTTLSGRAYERPTWGQGIDASGSSLSLGWPTAKATDSSVTRRGPNAQGGPGLAEVVLSWPTATARDWKSGQASDATLNRNSRPLNEVALATWPTPDASVANDGEDLTSWLARRERVKETAQNGNGMGTPLAVAVRLPETWPTATTGDANGSGSAGYSTASGRSEGTTLTDAAVRGIWAGTTDSSKSIKGAKLNPAWVEQLMGFPPGWTLLDPAKPKPNGKRPASSRKRKTEPRGSKPSATPSSRKSRKSSAGG